MATVNCEVSVIRRDVTDEVTLVLQGVDYNITEAEVAGTLVDKLEQALTDERRFVRIGNTIVPLDYADIPTFKVTIVSKSAD